MFLCVIQQEFPSLVDLHLSSSQFNLELNFTMRIIFTLFLALAAANALEHAAESYDEHRLLRGPNDTEDDEDRDLQLSIGSASKAFSFSAVSSYGAGDFCFDYYSSCLEDGFADTAAKTYTDASGNSIAFAESSQYLFLYAFCDSFAASYALTCAFTKVDGDIKINTKTVNSKKVITLGLELKAASTTFAKAESLAAAKAFTAIDSQAFTDVGVVAFCNKYPYFPSCSGFAGTKLEQIATANAISFGVASASSGSISLAQSGACVETEGSAFSYVNGIVWAHVLAWSFAEAEAAAVAFAKSYTDVMSSSFAGSCVKQHGILCANSSAGFCGSSAEEACAVAKASGESWAEALALACAKSFIKAFAGASSSVYLMANVDCRKAQPALTWTTTPAGVVNSC
jgi:hypothetical protein